MRSQGGPYYIRSIVRRGDGSPRLQPLLLRWWGVPTSLLARLRRRSVVHRTIPVLRRNNADAKRNRSKRAATHNATQQHRTPHVATLSQCCVKATLRRCVVSKPQCCTNITTRRICYNKATMLQPCYASPPCCVKATSPPRARVSVARRRLRVWRQEHPAATQASCQQAIR